MSPHKMSNEDSSRDDQANNPNPSSSNAVVSRSPAAPWLRLKDPRIVRVSRAFGGKDRHSKVCTIRGLRDRRVRLSVPTAIQLYDLQERLGLNQPSKVVDWLLDAAKHDIDDLPPLPLPPSANFGEGPSSTSTTTSNFWTSTISDAIWRAKSKEIAKEKEEQSPKEMTHVHNHPFFPGILTNEMPNYGHYPQNWEPTSSNFGLSQATDLHNFINVGSLPSGLSLATPPQSYFPSHDVAAAPPRVEIDPRQFNQHLQMLSSSTSTTSSSTNSQNFLPDSLSPPDLYPNSRNDQMRAPYLSMMTKFAHCSNNQPNKDQE